MKAHRAVTPVCAIRNFLRRTYFGVCLLLQQPPRALHKQRPHAPAMCIEFRTVHGQIIVVQQAIKHYCEEVKGDVVTVGKVSFRTLPRPMEPSSRSTVFSSILVAIVCGCVWSLRSPGLLVVKIVHHFPNLQHNFVGYGRTCTVTVPKNSSSAHHQHYLGISAQSAGRHSRCRPTSLRPSESWYPYAKTLVSVRQSPKIVWFLIFFLAHMGNFRSVRRVQPMHQHP